MPTAFKLEKQTSFEVPDPVKQVLTMVEKKVRNLEKRKGKLDTYKNDHENGKVLNDDQKNAIKKYDLVVELLEFAKELQKSFNNIIHENIKLQKKAAKREQIERQQQEIQRIKELLMLQDILVNMGTPEIRNDFLLGNNGALQLDEDKLNQLDEFYKLISPDRNSEDDDIPFEEQLLNAAEHLTSLLDGKNKEILNTTYKSLKELLTSINDCSYFNPTSKSGADNSIEENKEDQDFTDVSQDRTEILPSSHLAEEECVDSVRMSCTSTALPDTQYYSTVQYTEQSQPLQEVLPVQGNFNFLQESQIDLQSLHMDPAVVVAHPMIPPTSMGYPAQYHSGSNLTSQDIQESQNDGDIVRSAVVSSIVSSQQQLQIAASNNTGVSLQQQPVNPPQEYDPACPIPTQTYTNQNFATVHPIVPVTVPGNFVPSALGHPSLPQMVPVGMVPQHVSRTPSPPVSDSHVRTMASQDSGIVNTNVNLGPSDNKEFDSEYQIQQDPADNGNSSAHFATSEFQQIGDSQSFSDNHQNFSQNRNYTAGRGNRSARSRGSANGYTAKNAAAATGRGGYGNGRSGYQNPNNYYKGSYGGRDNFNNNIATNYNNAYKQKGSVRGGASRGVTSGTRGANNGRGGYRSQ